MSARLVDGEVVGVQPHDGVSPSPQPSPIKGEGEQRVRDSNNPLSPPSEMDSNSPLSPPWERVRVRGNKGVTLADGSAIEGDVVVLAMGPWSKSANSLVGV